MLTRLEIRNFAVISHVIFEPGKGLNVISGETGAGKSLLIDAIGLILGDKASKSLIRSDCDKAYVEALFDITSLSDELTDKLKGILTENGIPLDDENLIISREINVDGKSTARINGRTQVLSVLKDISSIFVDIHGQNDTQKIFDESIHVDLLDRFIGSRSFELISEYNEILRRYKDTVIKIKELGSTPEANQKRKEYLEFVSSQIKEADFKSGEEEELTSMKQKFLQSSKINALLEESDEILYSSEDSVTDMLKKASGLMQKLASIDESFSEVSGRIESLSMDVEAVASEVNSRYSADPYSEEMLDNIDSRLGLLYDLKGRYGNTIDEINAFAEKADNEIYEIDNSAKILASLRKDLKNIESELLSKADELSSLRHEYADILSSKIVNELNDLEMSNTRFEVVFTDHPKNRFFSNKGTEDISFTFSANPGESLKPLSKIASGGEASRIMLAIKTILSEADRTPTLIFDEIDTGISGVAALKVSEKLLAIASHHQVLSVTHTAQIAAAADQNYYISKKVEDNSSKTTIDKLDSNGKVIEVSRLLSGTSDEKSLELARNLIGRF
ncbi:MAG: DNA repair protein RecN [Clostridiales bacterium]|nr:DNA repair protein RecN [Clostridiales bacterium]